MKRIALAALVLFAVASSLMGFTVGVFAQPALPKDIPDSPAARAVVYKQYIQCYRSYWLEEARQAREAQLKKDTRS